MGSKTSSKTLNFFGLELHPALEVLLELGLALALGLLLPLELEQQVIILVDRELVVYLLLRLERRDAVVPDHLN